MLGFFHFYSVSPPAYEICLSVSRRPDARQRAKSKSLFALCFINYYNIPIYLYEDMIITQISTIVTFQPIWQHSPAEPKPAARAQPGFKRRPGPVKIYPIPENQRRYD